jgi:hypothetical protein
MSLLTSVNSGASGLPYAIQNIGRTADTPCIKGGFLSATPGVSDTTVRVGSDVSGMILTGGGGSVLSLVRGINGGTANTSNGEQLFLGASAASSNNIVLTDGLTAINGDLVMAAATSDLTVGGDISVGGGITFINGASGESISGYYDTAIASASYPDVADTPLATPGDLTAGWYIYSISAAPGSQAEQCVSTLVYYNGTIFSIGGTIQSAAGAGTFGFKVADDRTTMRLHNATGAAQTVTVNIAKLLN